MICRFKIYIGEDVHDIANSCIKNLDEIAFSLERKDYSGVTRSFTSEFEFVGEAHDLLLSLYEKSGLMASAEIAVETINNDWTFTEQFRCPLDFSTLEDDSHTLTISSVDNTLAAKLNAKKRTKYSFSLSDKKIFPRNEQCRVKRLTLRNHAHYDVSSQQSVDASKPTPLEMTYDKSEVISTSLFEPTDSGEKNRFFISSNAYHVPLRIVYNFKFDADFYAEYEENTNKSVGVFVFAEDASNDMLIDTIATNSLKSRVIGDAEAFPNLQELEYAARQERELTEGDFGIVGVSQYGSMHYWTDNVLYEWNGEEFVNMGRPDQYRPRIEVSGEYTLTDTIKETVYSLETLSSNKNAEWIFEDSVVDVFWEDEVTDRTQWSVIKPQQYIQALVNEITGDSNHKVTLSDYDPRLANTRLLPGESVRQLTDAKIYGTFTEFCNWISAVFGYTYQISDNDIHFLHRAELFTDKVVKQMVTTKDFKYIVQEDLLYSEVDCGYDKQSYDSINGRDEFNFTTYYTTGFNVQDKKLELKSKYRADSYGIEFTARKASQSTTDDKSDEKIFFVHIKTPVSPYVVIDDGVSVAGILSSNAYNGCFSPRACAIANEAYIAAVANGKAMTLTATTAEGNTTVMIDGVSVGAPVEIPEGEALFTAGEVEFSTDDVDIPSNWNGLVSVKHDGKTYKGYIRKVEAKYSRVEALKYTLIVKSVEQI